MVQCSELLAHISDRNFQRSPENDRKCRNGRECRYQHRNADGSTHVFDHGAKDTDERDGSDDSIVSDIHYTRKHSHCLFS